ncbi:envelope biogenesis factor ElyC [Thorsellia kenyensis]|uniref:Envelope biogenesis factor ElyC n=1 Tax=Thorsellia kenyensis TaxID=1549888 RepID=A0ABV6CC63_9GAMM
MDSHYTFGFVLKKLVGGLVQPLPLVILLLVLGVVLLWLKKSQVFAKIAVTAGTVSLLLMSLQPVSSPLLSKIEAPFATFDKATILAQHPNIKYIVVLGGGHTYNPQWAPSSNVLNNSLPRIVEGIRIHLSIPNSQLIFTGGAALNKQSAAKSAEDIALSLGVLKDNVVLADLPRDTVEEALAVKSIVGDSEFILVTSANHLPRATDIFKAQGLNPLPMPANQLAITTDLPFYEKWFPRALYLSHFERVWYEYLGQMWQKIKGNDN